jgi:hypothetical protein
VAFSATEQISTVVQPRINAGSPPDMINNSGSNLMDMGAIVKAGQAADLTDLYDAPSWDIAGKTVRDTLVPGAIEVGTFNGKPYAMNYAFTVFGLWYNSKLFAKHNWTPPATWADFTALCDKVKAAGITAFGYAGANASYYMVRADPDQRREDRHRAGAQGHRQPQGGGVAGTRDQAGRAGLGRDRQQVHQQDVPRPQAHRGPASAEPGQAGDVPVRVLAGERAGQGHPTDLPSTP